MAGEGQRFFGIYFFVAVAGSILIVFSAPFVSLPERLPVPVARAIHWLDQNATLRKLSTSLSGALSWKLPPDQLPAQAPHAGELAVPLQQPEVMPLSPEPALVPVTGATGMLETVTSKPELASPPESVPAPELVPSSEPPPETNRWGIVRSAETKVYSRKGKFLARVVAGSTLDICDMIEAEAGVFARGSVYGLTNSFDDVLVATNDLEIRVGAYRDVSAQEKDLRSAEARLLVELALHDAGLPKYLRKDYPMMTEFLRIKQEYLDYWKKVRALQDQLNGTEGPGRMRIEDSLRLMRGDDVRLGQAYEAAKGAYEEWRRATPEPSGQEKIEIDALGQELARIRSELDSFDTAQQ